MLSMAVNWGKEGDGLSRSFSEQQQNPAVAGARMSLKGDLF